MTEKGCDKSSWRLSSEKIRNAMKKKGEKRAGEKRNGFAWMVKKWEGKEKRAGREKRIVVGIRGGREGKRIEMRGKRNRKKVGGANGREFM